MGQDKCRAENKSTECGGVLTDSEIQLDGGLRVKPQFRVVFKVI